VQTVLAKYSAQYFHCAKCGFVRTEQPYWLEEAYSDAITVTDTGVLQRNWSLSAKLACLLYTCVDPAGAYVDVGGGYGILTRMMRDYGFDYYWEDKFCANLVARGFEATAAGKPFTAMSGFEVMEHTVNPVVFLEEIMHRYKCRTFVFSTVPYSGNGPPRADWWYLSPATGQHISFFHIRTLQYIADRLGLAFHTSGGLHLYTDRRLRNSHMFPLVASKLAYVLAQAVRLRLGSRTWKDCMTLSDRLTRSEPGSRVG
jgi:hypothetical protein